MSRQVVLGQKSRVFYEGIPYNINVGATISVNIEDLERVYLKTCVVCDTVFEVPTEKARHRAKKCPYCKRQENLRRNKEYRLKKKAVIA